MTSRFASSSLSLRAAILLSVAAVFFPAFSTAAEGSCAEKPVVRIGFPAFDGEEAFVEKSNKMLEITAAHLKRSLPQYRFVFEKFINEEMKQRVAEKRVDFFLMPSKFEPCGLSQLIAMRYGSLPIVRATGGLEDTVTGYPLDNSTGFKFWRYDGWDMKEAINCALNVYKDKFTFNAMRQSAMNADFSWKKSSEKYLQMYKELLS